MSIIRSSDAAGDLGRSCRRLLGYNKLNWGCSVSTATGVRGLGRVASTQLSRQLSDYRDVGNLMYHMTTCFDSDSRVSVKRAVIRRTNLRTGENSYAIKSRKL